MASSTNLDDLLRAIHNSLIEAQKLSEQQHIRQLARYFEDDGTPIIRTIKVPDPSPTSEADAHLDINVPLVSLIPPTALKIKSLMMKFKVGLRGFGGKDKDKGKKFRATHNDPETHAGPVEIDLGGISGSFFSSKNILADVEITFESCDPAESFLRINDHLVKTIR